MNHEYSPDDVDRLKARIAALEDLLGVHEEAVIKQCEQLDHTVYALRQQTEELTRSEHVLRESEESYRLLFENNPNPMWVYDLETLAFLAVNNAAIRHYGYTREEFLAMTIKDIRPAEHVPLLLEEVKRVSQGLSAAGVWTHRKRDGSLIDVEITGHTLIFGTRQA
jgi:PAS domain S-box-containing protein